MRSTARGFDRLAPHYGWMEAFAAGGRLQRCREAWLGSVSGVRRALLAGEGHGRFLPAAAAAWPNAEFTVVDASAAMLERARRRWDATARPARVAWIVGELPRWQAAAGAFDLIVTHFFLDCFPPGEIGAVIAALAAGATPKARWLVSEFAVPARPRFARWRARAILALAYGFFRVATGLRARQLPDYAPELARHGFVRRDRQSFEWGLLHAEWWERGCADDPARV